MENKHSHHYFPKFDTCGHKLLCAFPDIPSVPFCCSLKPAPVGTLTSISPWEAAPGLEAAPASTVCSLGLARAAIRLTRQPGPVWMRFIKQAETSGQAANNLPELLPVTGPGRSSSISSGPTWAKTWFRNNTLVLPALPNPYSRGPGLVHFPSLIREEAGKRTGSSSSSRSGEGGEGGEG